MDTTRLQDKIGQAIRAVVEAKVEARSHGKIALDYEVSQCLQRLEQAFDALAKAEHHAQVADTQKEPA